jgi:flagellar motility protein MotE (MotC chaperone)
MRSFSWHKRLLPLTMTVMALLFTEKAVSLTREATAKEPTQVASAAVQPPAVAGTVPLPPLLQPSLLPAAANAVSAPASVSPAEIQLLQDLRKRRQALDERERRINQKADLVQAAESKLQAKLDELTLLQARLEQVEDGRKKRENANWSSLVKTYEDMKPRDAAAIFDVLDLNVMLEVLDRMEERKAAALLAAMLPERARLATQMLAQRRIRADAAEQRPDPSGPVALAADQHG